MENTFILFMLLLLLLHVLRKHVLELYMYCKHVLELGPFLFKIHENRKKVADYTSSVKLIE